MLGPDLLTDRAPPSRRETRRVERGDALATVAPAILVPVRELRWAGFATAATAVEDGTSSTAGGFFDVFGFALAPPGSGNVGCLPFSTPVSLGLCIRK